MEPIAGKGFSAKQKTELWERWGQGQCVADIARALQRMNKSGVDRVLALNGGITPSSRRRSAMALTLEEREEISRGIAVGSSIRAIAAKLGRAASTVSREVNRNGGRGVDRASDAEGSAWERAHRPKPCRLATHPAPGRLRDLVAAALAEAVQQERAVIESTDRQARTSILVRRTEREPLRAPDRADACKLREKRVDGHAGCSSPRRDAIQ